jgi:hypothetical protein
MHMGVHAQIFFSLMKHAAKRACGPGSEQAEWKYLNDTSGQNPSIARSQGWLNMQTTLPILP